MHKKAQNAHIYVLIAVLLVTPLDSNSYEIERSPRRLRRRIHVHWEDEPH